MNPIVQAVLNGEADEDFAALVEAIADRKALLARQVARTLKHGDTVRVVGDLRPRYLIGLTGKVERVNQKTVTMNFDDPEAARRYRAGVRMPIEYVEVVAA